MAIDGGNRESLWSDMNWYSMNYRWLGEPADSTDYFGRFKVAWDRHRLYVLVDMVNDVLYPTMIDGVENYWKGDYVEKNWTRTDQAQIISIIIRHLPFSSRRKSTLSKKVWRKILSFLTIMLRSLVLDKVFSICGE